MFTLQSGTYRAGQDDVCKLSTPNPYPSPVSLQSILGSKQFTWPETHDSSLCWLEVTAVTQHGGTQVTLCCQVSVLETVFVRAATKKAN